MLAHTTPNGYLLACGASFSIKEIDINNTPCPECGAELKKDAVLCVECGYHLTKGKRIETVFSDPDAVAVSDTADATTTWGQPQEGDLPSAIFWFDGRISRARWWVINAVFFAVIGLLGLAAEEKLIPEVLLGIAMFPLAWIVLCAQIRRWHDLDRSGVWCLVLKQAYAHGVFG